MLVLKAIHKVNQSINPLKDGGSYLIESAYGTHQATFESEGIEGVGFSACFDAYL